MPQVLVTGANRGLGLEFVKQYAFEGWRVIALCRTAADNDELKELAETQDISIEVLDVTDFGEIDALAEKYKHQPIDILINNAAVFGPRAQADGDLRQNFGHMDYDLWRDLLEVNTLAPYKLVEAFVENIAASEEKKIVTISATPGSIGQTDKGLNAYRTTKAALNMVMATLAKELSPQGISVIMFCPGWVKTRMGTDAAPLMTEESIRGMRKQIEGLTMEASGEFRRYNGDVIPW